MKLSARTVKGCVLVTVEAGGLNYTTSDELREQLVSIQEDHRSRRMVLDMSQVTYVDSRAVGALVSARKTIGAAGGVMDLCGLKDYVQKILDVVTMGAIFRVYATAEEALTGRP